jgi:hypothetical protein
MDSSTPPRTTPDPKMRRRPCGSLQRQRFCELSTDGANLRPLGKSKRSEPGRGSGRIREAIQHWRELGATLALTYYFTILGDACLAAGADEEGLAAVQEALKGNLGEERCYYAALHRLEAEFLARAGKVEEAVSALRTARNIATGQGSKSFQLRILTTSLRLLPASYGNPEAIDELRQLAQWFKDSGPTPDMAEAQHFLKVTRI